MFKTLMTGAALATFTLAAPSASLAQDVPPVSDSGAFPVEYWAAQPAVKNVSLSPDGERMAMLVTPGLDADPVIQVFDTADLSKTPKRFNASNLEITRFRWVSNGVLAVDFRGQVRERIRGFNQGTYQETAATLDVKKGKFNQLGEGRVVSGIASEPNKVIFAVRDGRAVDFYEADVKKGTRRLVTKTTEMQDPGSLFFDDEGNPRAVMQVDLGGGGRTFQTLYRAPGERSWRTIYEVSENSFEEFGVAGFFEDPRYVYAVAHNGRDKKALWKYDTQERVFVEELASRDDVDLLGVRTHSDSKNFPNKIVAAVYGRESYVADYFEDEVSQAEAGLVGQLEGAVPNAHNVRIASRSDDGDTLIVRNVGPKDPSSYYLLSGGALSYIGSSNPFVQADGLGETSYVTYRARDGRTIPAYVTTPPRGEAPYPTIVLPHGGPFAPEVVTYDKWTQMFANNGYMVIQPQFRGSQGHGLEHYKAAFIPSGQGGYAMQDDKDDSAMWAVGQGMADPDRLAMFGWSYGGYAALVAAQRDEQIYQCAIAGASVPDTSQQVNYYKDQLRGAQAVEQLAMWSDSYNPIQHAGDVNIPLLLIHGTSDQRTPLRGLKDYMKALDRAGSAYDYVELPKADHFSNSIGYENERKAYAAMLDFLADDCAMPTAQNAGGRGGAD